MGRPKKSEGEATRARLLHAAEIEFGAAGYDRARLEDIAAAAGIRRSSLLYYFGNKETLYREVVATFTADLKRSIREVISLPGDAMVRLERIGALLISFAEAHKAGVAMFVRELLDSPAAGEEHIGEFVAVVDMIESFVADEAAHLIPDGAPTRALLLHLMTSEALRIASGRLGERVWGTDAVDPLALVRALLTQR